AAPGGKATHIATLMKNEGKVYAIDKSASKVEGIKKLCKQMGISCIQAVQADSTKILRGDLLRESTTTIQFDAETFDRILLDPPCSGLGQRPRIKDNTSLVTLNSYHKYQQKLFHVAVRLLKVGGILV